MIQIASIIPTILENIENNIIINFSKLLIQDFGEEYNYLLYKINDRIVLRIYDTNGMDEDLIHLIQISNDIRRIVVKEMIIVFQKKLKL